MKNELIQVGLKLLIFLKDQVKESMPNNLNYKELVNKTLYWAFNFANTLGCIYPEIMIQTSPIKWTVIYDTLMNGNIY